MRSGHGPPWARTIMMQMEPALGVQFPQSVLRGIKNTKATSGARQVPNQWWCTCTPPAVHLVALPHHGERSGLAATPQCIPRPGEAARPCTSQHPDQEDAVVDLDAALRCLQSGMCASWHALSREGAGTCCSLYKEQGIQQNQLCKRGDTTHKDWQHFISKCTV